MQFSNPHFFFLKMGGNITKLFIISVLYLTNKLVEGQSEVPCVYFFGDSLFDNGNNNHLNTSAKANYFPYGIDYPGGVATGRFSNGKNIADFLAEMLGFDEAIPPYATANGTHNIINGVNYASGAGGILDQSGSDQGERISMNMQLANHNITISQTAELGIGQEHLQQCLYVVYIGNNDYLNNYLLPQYFDTSNLYTPQQFAALLIQDYSHQLTTLYLYGARKVAVFGLTFIGCIPYVLPQNGNCVESINNMAQQFNAKLVSLLDKLNAHLTGAMFIYINTTSITTGDPALIGITVSNRACCLVTSKQTGLCDAGKEPCSNRNEYEFWDKFHPTEYGAHEMASRAYTAWLPSDDYPFDIRHLIQTVL